MGLLTPPEIITLRDGLLAAYLDYDELDMMVTEVGQSLPQIVSDKLDLQVVIFKLVRKADAEGWISKLIQTAYKDKSGSSTLTQAVMALRQNHAELKDEAGEEKAASGATVDSREAVLFSKLLELNHNDQWGLFRSFVIQHKAGAFLTYGDSAAQRVLLTRLINDMAQATTSLIFPLSFFRDGIPKDLDGVWSDLCCRFKLDRTLIGQTTEERIEAMAEKLAERLRQNLQSQNIIFIFDDISRGPKTTMPELYQLWRGLMKRIGSDHKYKIIMFAKDLDGRANTGEITCLEQWKKNAEPDVLVILRMARFFTKKDLRNWIKRLPIDFIDDPKKIVKVLIHPVGQGLPPDPVYKQICTYFGYDWYAGVSRWYKLE